MNEKANCVPSCDDRGADEASSPSTSGRRNSCAWGCTVILAVAFLAIAGAGVWIWRLNRNPNPFPWRPEREWMLSAKPLAVDFVESDGSLLVLCGNGTSEHEATSIVKCDGASNEILSTVPLSFPASTIAVYPNHKAILVAGIIPSKDDPYINIRRNDGMPVAPHSLRTTILRMSDWAVEAAIEESVEPAAFSFKLAQSLRVRPLHSQHAWLVGIAFPGEEIYRVSLLDWRTLSVIRSRSFPCGPHLSRVCISVDPQNPSTVLLGRPYGDSYHYRWDRWATDSDDADSTELRLGIGMPSELTWGIALPEDFDVSECQVPRAEDEIISISGGGSLVARAINDRRCSAFPSPVPDQFLAELAIWSLSSGKPIVKGIFQGKAEVITALRFSRDNKYLITCHQGGMVRAWKLAKP